MKVFIDGDGCILRKLDSNRLYDYFLVNKAEIRQSPEGSDFIIYVTCAVNQIMVDLCVSKIKKYNLHGSKMIIVGCMPDITPDLIAKNCNDYHTISTRNLDCIDNIFSDFSVKYKEVPVSTILTSDGSQHVRHRFNFSKSEIFNFSKGRQFFSKYLFYTFHKKISEKQFAFLVTSKGCDHHCTYCGIKTAVGSLKSLPKQTVLNNYKEMLAKGYRHIFFFSDDTGAYGNDIRENFSDLLILLDQHSKPDTTWAFVNLHPTSLIKHFDTIEELVQSKRIVFIECAIQHFSASILKRMNRFYDVNIVLGKLSVLKKSYSRLCITTHIIFGFPGETEEDIRLAGSYCEKASIDYYDLLLYFENETSPSIKFKDKILPDVVYPRIKHVSSILTKKSTLHSIFPPEFLDDCFDDTYLLVKKVPLLQSK